MLGFVPKHNLSQFKGYGSNLHRIKSNNFLTHQKYLTSLPRIESMGRLFNRCMQNADTHSQKIWDVV